MQLHRAPQVPRRSRAIRLPALAIGEQRLRLRQVAEAVGKLETLAHAEVIAWQHVGAAQAEHQQHLGRPPADAAHGNEALDQLVVGERGRGVIVGDGAIEGLRGEVFQRGDLREGEADAAQHLGGRRVDVRRSRKRAVVRVHQAIEDPACDESGDLLARDRAGEVLETRARARVVDCAPSHDAGDA
jgi:hypothetical protein